MPQKNTPSSVMYAQIKRFGMSNYEAATLLMNTQLTFDGRPLKARISESSQLSRRIVHVAPGELPRGLFNDFQLSCSRIARKLLERNAVNRFHGDLDLAASELNATLAAKPADDMARTLNDSGADSAIFRNMMSFITRAELEGERDRFTLMLMMFVVTGCLGNPRTASILTIDYATEILGIDFQTAQTVIGATPARNAAQNATTLGLVRITDGHIRAGSQMHVLHPEGTEVGLLPEGKHTIAEVGADASRRHARLWREGELWFIEDLGSTNGTFVISGTTGETHQVEGEALSVHPTDIVRLGSDTYFMVMPALGG